MADKKVFVSYDYTNDKHYRYLLSAWDANTNFDFSFDDHSTPKIDSTDASRIKAAITAKMRGATCLLVIVGEHTASSTWVDWEIANAKVLGLSLVAVKIARSYSANAGLLGAGTVWANAFDQAPIVKALSSC